MIEVLIVRMPGCEDLDLPRRATELAAGFDLRAAVSTPVVIESQERAMIPTGFCLGIPAGYEAQIRPRSGLALRHGVTTLNSPGTIDADYRGEVNVILLNTGKDPFTVHRGDRIAQMVVAQLPDVVFRETDRLTDTERGSRGFGHTGL